MPEFIIAANWKMHKTLQEGIALAKEVETALKDKKVPTVVLFPTFLHLPVLAQQLDRKGSLRLGAQNVHPAASGAYTGEISPTQLRALPVDYVLIGHSERRIYFQEDAVLLKSKLKSALKHGLRPILCCGEPLSVRERGEEENYVRNQLSEILEALDPPDYQHLVLAYEPIWAIGTGQVATPEQVQYMHVCLRSYLSTLDPQAAQTPIIYGGSVAPESAQDLFACPDIDGALVGGASLQANTFLDIIDAYTKSPKQDR